MFVLTVIRSEDAQVEDDRGHLDYIGEEEPPEIPVPGQNPGNLDFQHYVVLAASMLSRPQFEKTCQAKQNNVKSHVFCVFKKRKKRKKHNGIVGLKF